MFDEENENPETEEQETTEEVESQEEELESQEEDSAQSESVPMAAFLELKKKYKNVRNERDTLRHKNLDTESQAFIDEKKQKYLSMGYNEELAEELAKDLAEVRGLATKSKAKNDIEIAILEDIADMSKDPLYEGIEEYEDAILKKVTEARRKGFDLEIEDAYFMVSKYQKRTKAKEKRVNDSQREVIERKQVNGTSTTNVPTSGGSAPKVKYNLDAHDKKALAGLQKAQPDAKWTAEKYYNMMKKDK